MQTQILILLSTEAQIKLHMQKPIACRLMQSYGSMFTVLRFLSPLNQTKMQGLDRWWYTKGVSRIQFKARKPKRDSIFFIRQ